MSIQKKTFDLLTYIDYSMYSEIDSGGAYLWGKAKGHRHPASEVDFTWQMRLSDNCKAECLDKATADLPAIGQASTRAHTIPTGLAYHHGVKRAAIGIQVQNRKHPLTPKQGEAAGLPPDWVNGK